MSALFATWELQPILKRIVKGLRVVPTKYRSVALPFYQILRAPHAIGHNDATTAGERLIDGQSPGFARPS